MSRRALVLAVAAAVLPALSACHHGGVRSAPAGGDAVYAGPGVPGPVGAPIPGVHTLADRGEQTLTHLPWPTDVARANLASRGPVALTGFYLMREDAIAISNIGTIYCLSLRDLTPRWVSSLRSPLLSAPAETPVDYVFLVQDARGASYLQVFSKRSGAESGVSPIRLPFAPSSGVSATAATAYVGSYGSPVDNKTLESVNLADGSLGWGYRTRLPITGTPTVDPSGEILIVPSQDETVTALPANPAGSPPANELWIGRTLGNNSSSPFVTRDWMFLGSQDNMLRGYNVHSGEVMWMRGTDAPIKRTPWVLGGTVVQEVAGGGAEGAPKVRVETFEGIVFVHNARGLHAFDAVSGDPLFLDAFGDRPLVRAGDWLVTLDTQKGAHFRRGAKWAEESTLDFSWADFVPTNVNDSRIVTATADGTVLLAKRK